MCSSVHSFIYSLNIFEQLMWGRQCNGRRTSDSDCPHGTSWQVFAYSSQIGAADGNMGTFLLSLNQWITETLRLRKAEMSFCHSVRLDQWFSSPKALGQQPQHQCRILRLTLDLPFWGFSSLCLSKLPRWFGFTLNLRTALSIQTTMAVLDITLKQITQGSTCSLEGQILL